MTPILFAFALSTPAHAAFPLSVDASTPPVELEAVVEDGTLDLVIDGERLSEWDDALAITNVGGGAVEIAVTDAVDTNGTTWTIQVTAYEGRTSTTWERDADGAWTTVDGEAYWDLVVTAQADTKGKSKAVVTYGPVITIKPKG